MIVDTIPNDLWRWWIDMGSYEQRRVKEHLGHLVHLMEIDLRRDNVDAKKFLDLLKINQIEKESLKNGWVSLHFLYERYDQNDGFENYQNQLSNQGGAKALKANGCFAFMVSFLGLIFFPKRDKHIDIRLAGVVKVLTTMESPTIIPMILADMFCALTKCINREMHFEAHLYHHDRALRFTPYWCNYVSSHKEREAKINFPKGILLWNYYWFLVNDVICMYTGISFLVLIGLRCVQPYAPLRVMRR
ncbi:hypothetical protein R3W88_029498 [Solanum pinnatisectum]|uniref:Uncharacterized protein n=1 Tax=Solanum pinnatisectum TaxID=50273 RepID=A0AAV9K5X4_9SOLN|nr:hypothetical protein R3W88_029498 [Solanum pinnatisectum]